MLLAANTVWQAGSWPIGVELHMERKDNVSACLSCGRTAPLAHRLQTCTQTAQLNIPACLQVVDKLKAEELPKMAVFCRCWRSSKFPYCDGAHAKHNQVCKLSHGVLRLVSPAQAVYSSCASEAYCSRALLVDFLMLGCVQAQLSS